MVDGIVKWFDKDQGWGFITTKDGKDIFVHYSGIVDDEDGFKRIKKGDRVKFKIVRGNKGLQANNVVVMERKDFKKKVE
jgi:cold shock protein